jgi:hypothetical protein
MPNSQISQVNNYQRAPPFQNARFTFSASNAATMTINTTPLKYAIKNQNLSEIK